MDTKVATQVRVKLKHENIRDVKKWREECTPMEDVLVVLMHHQAFIDGDRGWIIKPVFSFLHQKAYHEKPKDGPDFKDFQYLYQSHNCPINFMRHFKAFTIRDSETKTDSDPHGLWTFVGWISKARLKEITGKDVAIDQFGLPETLKPENFSRDINWHDVAEQVFSDFRPDLDNHDIDNEIEDQTRWEEEKKKRQEQVKLNETGSTDWEVLRKPVISASDIAFIIESVRQAWMAGIPVSEAVNNAIHTGFNTEGRQTVVHVEIPVTTVTIPNEPLARVPAPSIPFLLDITVHTGVDYHVHVKEDDLNNLNNPILASQQGSFIVTRLRHILGPNVLPKSA